MLNGQQAVDIIANNIANSATPGFKPDRFYVELDRATVRTQMRQYIDFTDGSLRQTARSLDIALLGNNFLVVKRADGSTALSKGGSLVLAGDGSLQTQAGETVMGNAGPIKGDPAGEITITATGEVRQGGSSLDTLRIESAGNMAAIDKLGGGLFTGASQRSASFQVQSGSLEDSGSNPVTEAVNLITAFRAYETASRIVTTTDDLFNRAIQALRG